MSTRREFKADDTKRQAADSAALYLDRALHMTAERLGLEKTEDLEPTDVEETGDTL